MSEDGELMTRRRAILLGAAGLASVYAVPRWLLDDNNRGGVLADITGSTSAAADCVLTPEVTEGPYHIDTALTRMDVREGQKGVPLLLRLSVIDSTTCKAIEGADVEIWHADAEGEYSGFDGDGGGQTATRYLRGHQKTNANGVATFLTVFPGWYPGRSPHIHLKVYAGGNEVHTGQLFFATALAKRVYSSKYYKSRGQGWQRNSADQIYAQAGGRSAVLRTRRRNNRHGYVGYLTIGVNA
ncbi:MAG: intradiol ring-cleavage dioxygenase [Solirubrobacterales bacterium]